MIYLLHKILIENYSIVNIEYIEEYIFIKYKEKKIKKKNKKFKDNIREFGDYFFIFFLKLKII